MTDIANEPMHEIRGTLILCDHVYRTDQGKWVIAGTYAQWQTAQDMLVLPFLHVYIRLLFERPGTYHCHLTMVDRDLLPQSAPMIAVSFDINQPAAAAPVFETGLQLPELRIVAPKPYAQRPPGSVTVLHTLLNLRVRETDVASCPLDFHFLGPTPPLPTAPLWPPPGIA